MLRTIKSMKEKYEKIQSIIFSLIPERWEKIYLYASVVTTFSKTQSGEMFFYYIPKGIIKKKPINVYEVPERFNINEEQYLKVVRDLYECIKELKQDFIKTDQELWTNLTITITNINFKVEFNYDKLPIDEKENEKNRMIWRYKYLGIGGEKKKEQEILEEYFSRKKTRKDEIYETGLNIRTDNSGVKFGREEDLFHREFVIYEKDNDYFEDINDKPKEKKEKDTKIKKEKKLKEKELIEKEHKKKKSKQKNNLVEEFFDEEKTPHIKNQILN